MHPLFRALCHGANAPVVDLDNYHCYSGTCTHFTSISTHAQAKHITSTLASLFAPHSLRSLREIHHQVEWLKSSSGHGSVAHRVTLWLHEHIVAGSSPACDIKHQASSIKPQESSLKHQASSVKPSITHPRQFGRRQSKPSNVTHAILGGGSLAVHLQRQHRAPRDVAPCRDYRPERRTLGAGATT